MGDTWDPSPRQYTGSAAEGAQNSLADSQASDAVEFAEPVSGLAHAVALAIAKLVPGELASVLADVPVLAVAREEVAAGRLATVLPVAIAEVGLTLVVVLELAAHGSVAEPSGDAEHFAELVVAANSAEFAPVVVETAVVIAGRSCDVKTDICRRECS